MDLNELKQQILSRPEWAKHPQLLNVGFLRYLVNILSRNNYIQLTAQYLDYHDQMEKKYPDFVNGVGF